MARQLVAMTLVAVIALWGAARFLTWEPTGLARDSVLYRLKVPSQAKAMARWGSDGTVPLYDVRIGDGPAPAYTLIRYGSRWTLSQLATVVQADGFKCQPVVGDGVTCERMRNQIVDAEISAKREVRSQTLRVTIYVPDY